MGELEPFLRVLEALKDGPKSISDVKEAATINWRTAQGYLETLKQAGFVKEETKGRKRVFYYLENGTYFHLPVKAADTKRIKSFYHHITEACREIYKTEPTKTQVYKILWEIDKQKNLQLPIGWYQFGPCCVQIYNGDETADVPLNEEELSLVKKYVTKYCCQDNQTLQRSIYEKEGRALYQLKETLLACDHAKETINPLLMDLIKLVPGEAVDVTTDFARATLLLSWNKTGDLFPRLWKYLTMLEFRESLKFYYEETVEYYLDQQTVDAKREIAFLITQRVRNYTNSGKTTRTSGQSA